MVNLIPCIIHIAQRTEEPVLETLAAAMPKIFKALGNFTSDIDVKVGMICMCIYVVVFLDYIKRPVYSSKCISFA